MKPTFFFSACTLLTLVISLQSCVVGADLVKSTNYTVTHEHRVNLPANVYSPAASQLPMFDKKGEKSIAFSMTNSGENDDNDPNPNADPNNIKEGITTQDITQVRTFSLGGGYALTDQLAVIGNVQAGKGSGSYKPYIESWNLTEDLYSYEYWAGIPLGWDEYIGGTWYSNEKFTTLNEYQRIGKTLNHSYRYFEAEAGVGRYHSQDWVRAGFYGGLGYANNQFQGHLKRNGANQVYGEHKASLFKMYVLPAVSAHKGWIECGASMKTNFMLYKLNAGTYADQQFGAEKHPVVMLEPAMFLRIGPRYFQVQLESKYLGSVGKAPFPTNKIFTSVGVLSTF
ncbi:MAG: hypothetical protein JNJ57_08810 [Saprospiraceae bacterium]|nr:hypothetical protein [Saprospiraceae bacterium]